MYRKSGYFRSRLDWHHHRRVLLQADPEIAAQTKFIRFETISGRLEVRAMKPAVMTNSSVVVVGGVSPI